MSKTIILTTLVFWAICIEQIHAQGYIPMINDSLFWDVAYRVNDPHPCAIFGVGGPDRYKIGNDTIINGTPYKQIIRYDFLVLSPSGCPPFYVDTIPQALDFYIREDTAAQSVYRYNTTSQLDELLFDFSLQQHDSIFLPSSISPNTYFYVDTLYTVITNDGVSRKYFECFPRPSTTGGFYIEGLGGAMGPFERPYNVFEEGYWVLCISDLNESPIYPTLGSCFTFTTSLIQQESIIDELTVYPIPSSEKIFINDVQLNSHYTIYNLLGEVLERNRLEQEAIINISYYKTGVYFIKIESDNKVSVAKFVKQ